MGRNYLNVAFRNIFRNGKFTIVNIAGLGISIASCILIGLFVFNEVSFDKHVPGKNDIYRLNEYMHYEGAAPQLSAASGPPIAPYLKENHPEIEKFVRLYSADPYIYASASFEFEGKRINAAGLVCTDSGFAEMFGVRFIEGNKNDFLKIRNGIVLTQSMAYKIFGNNVALHKTLMLHTNDTIMPFSVSSVIADMPKTSHIQLDALLPIPEKFGGLEGNFGVLLDPTYFTLQPGINASAFSSKLTKTLHEKNAGIDVQLQKLSDVHTGSNDITYDFFNYKKIDGKYLMIFLLIGIAVFIIAVINFVNLTIAVNSYRGKEIAVRKIIGAKRLDVIMQMITETFISICFAIAIAIVLSFVCLPLLNSILDRDLSSRMLFQPAFIAGYIIVLLLTTLLAGTYPSWLIASLNANEALKTKVLGNFSKPILRNALVVGQFAIAIVFIISFLVFVKQLRYMQNKNLGYSYAQILKIPLDKQSAEKLPVIKGALLKIKNVEDITNGYIELGGDGGLFGIDYITPEGKQKKMSVNFENVGKTYIPFFDMKIVAGRNFIKDGNPDEYIINETLAKQIGYVNPIGQSINLSGGRAKGIVIGVVKDYNYSSLHKPIEPLIMASLEFAAGWQKQLYIKVTTQHLPETIKEVEAALTKITGNSELTYEFMDEHFKEIYHSERQASVMISIVGALAIIIACVGLLSLVAFAVIKRTKEIGIRKVIGASAGDITVMLSKDFLRLILIAMIVAFPLAWLAMHNWLQYFAYRVDIGGKEFIIAGAGITLIAMLAISWQAVKAALANPVKSLRTE